MKNFSIIFILILLLGCVKDHPNVIVINKSNMFFDSIQVYATPKKPTTFKNIKSNITFRGEILFDESMSSDGAYTIQLFKGNDTLKNYSFGYFTNGASLNRAFMIEVKNDTIIINSK